MATQYFIKDSYCDNPVISFDQTSAEARAYWEKADHLRGSLSYQWPVYKALARTIKETNSRTVADIGCGSGLKLSRIAASLSDSIEWTGFDQLSAIEFCRRNHTFGTFHEANLDEPIKSPNSFDIVNCSDVIEHLRQPEILLASIKSLVLPTGVCLISTPDRDKTRGLDNTRCPNPYHVREWNHAEFSAFLESQKFEILRSCHLFPIRFGRPFRLFGDVAKRILTKRSINYNMLFWVRPKR